MASAFLVLEVFIVPIHCRPCDKVRKDCRWNQGESLSDKSFQGQEDPPQLCLELLSCSYTLGILIPYCARPSTFHLLQVRRKEVFNSFAKSQALALT